MKFNMLLYVLVFAGVECVVFLDRYLKALTLFYISDDGVFLVIDSQYDLKLFLFILLNSLLTVASVFLSLIRLSRLGEER